MAGFTMIALDSNVPATRALRAPGRTELDGAIARALAAGEAFGLPLPCIGEFYRVVTWDQQPNRLAPLAALSFLEDWISRNNIMRPGARFWTILSSLIREHQPSSVGIFDYQIAAVCLEHGIDTIWTLDTRFPRVEGLNIVNPLSL